MIKKIFFVVLLIIFLSGPVSLLAHETETDSSNHRTSYREKGFQLGGAVGGSIGLDLDGTINGRLDVFAGYQFNSYVALYLDAWTINFIIGGAEISPRFYLSDGKISPFVITSIGLSTTNPSFSDESEGTLNYSGGMGIDWYFKQKQTLQFIVRYWGSGNVRPRPESASFSRALEFSFGYRWSF